ncbi:protein ALP1-like [Salvia hispanica]|uniref:protein ALP1-like n=1 Tax=Salvia hispanica TaxID=49212 RepID=UPI0020098334|nr:protein ALP1-like [Salvia hispanica]
MNPRREGQRAIEAQMARMLETAMPAIQEEINNEVERYQAAIQAWNEQHDRVPRTRMYIHRDREQAGLRLFMDYFSADPRWSDQMFRRRFRMRRNVFLRIVNAVVAHDAYFMQTFDAVGRQSISTLQKCTSALRQLAYGTAADMFDEYLHVSEHTGRACLAKFCRAVIEAFKDTYLRKPTSDDVRRLVRMHEERHGFPGMLGSIDCMHWPWKNYPMAWRGAFTSGHKGSHPTIVLEAVADQRLWIWHAYFGVAGSNNDLNVLNGSPLFNDLCAGRAPTLEFTANHRRYTIGYYLADEIYPRWPVFVKTITCPTTDRRKLFAKKQEAARKDVERAFGVLQSRWAIVKGPARGWPRPLIADIMYACIIMHNMIVEDEGDNATDWSDDPLVSASSSYTVTDPIVQGVPPDVRNVMARSAAMRQEDQHTRLQADLIEEIWNRN